MADRGTGHVYRGIDEARRGRLEEAAKGFNSGLLYGDASGRILFASQPACQLFGEVADDLEGRLLSDYLDREALERLQVAVARGGLVTEDAFPVQLRRASGDIPWMQYELTQVPGAIGEPPMTCLLVRDATELYESARLRSYLATIVDSIDDAIISTDLVGVITTWNAGAERTFRYRPEEAIGQSIAFLANAANHAALSLVLLEVLAGERTHHEDAVRIRKDRSLVEVSEIISAVYDFNGRPIGATVVYRDIYDRLRSEEDRSRMAAIVESSDDAIISKDLQGTIRTWNRGAQRLFGYTAEEAIGQSMTMLLPADRHGEEAEILAGLRDGDKFDHLLTTRLTKDGRLVDLFITISPIYNSHGEVVGGSKVARDVTRLTRAQRQRDELTAELEKKVEVRTAELRDAVAELESFTYSASHDLRAPLRSVEICRRMLLEDADSHFSPFAAGQLERQRSAVERMNRLITDLLNYAKVSRHELHPRVLDVEDIVVKVWSELAQEVQGRPLALRIEPGITAWGDPSLVRFIYQNLIQNSVKYSPDGGLITVGQSPNGALFVQDEGIGFDMKFANKLFEPFERLVNQSDYPGSGIGLANVKRLVGRHSGMVWANSELGKGATFYFTLDDQSTADPADEPSAA